MIYHDSTCSIYFGNASDGIYPQQFYDIPNNIVQTPPFSRLKSLLNTQFLIFFHQIHSDQGLLINPEHEAMRSWSVDGDYLITNTSIALGVLSADCLPVIFVDEKYKAVGIAHAGWRGSMQNIAVKTVEAMRKNFGSDFGDMRVFFGPSARRCCYQINEDFLTNIEQFSYAHEAISKKNNQLYFDLPLFNQRQLETVGISPDHIKSQYNLCTICDAQFYSYRRQKEAAGRQMTVVKLNQQV